MTRRAGFEPVEHTADLAVRAWGEGLAELIEQAARGMLSLMLEDPPQATDTVEVTGEGADPEDLLIDCLREILALIELRGLVPVSVDVLGADESRAACAVGVVELEAGRENIAQDVKAVTYHGVEVRSVNGLLEVEVVFDV